VIRAAGTCTIAFWRRDEIRNIINKLLLKFGDLSCPQTGNTFKTFQANYRGQPGKPGDTDFWYSDEGRMDGRESLRFPLYMSANCMAG
jgi:hypothetical protein